MNDTLATPLELNELAAKLIRHELLGQREIDLLEKGVQALSGTSPISSEIASISNNIWLLIHELPVQIYWITISNILTHAKLAYTKSLSLNSISKRIAYDWPHLEQHQKVNISQYIFSLHNDAVERGNQFGMIGEVTMALFRLEWGGLLNGFVAKMADNLAAMPAKNILFNLQLLKRVLRQSFDTWSEDFLTVEYEHFRAYVEGEMRQVMKLTCFCLSQSIETQLILPSCLKFLQQIVDIVPVFELFNCELLEILQKLLKTKQFGKSSMACLKEIFAFKEIGIKQQHHSKIARRLLSILEKEIQSCISQTIVTNFDKQSSSTTDSFCSRLTVSHNRPTVNYNRPKDKSLSPDLVDLLYLYLTRYIPSMDSRPDQRFFEIQSDQSTKLLFQKELYNYFEKGFWTFVQFLIDFGTKSDQKLSALSQEEYQTQFRYLVCCKLIFVLFGKLGLTYEDLLQKLLTIFIVRLAPLEKAFRKFYILFDLIMDDTTVYIQLEEVHNFSEEYCQIYTQGMEVILKNRTLAQNYFTAVQKLLLKIVEGSCQQMNPKKDKMQVCYKVNLVNRISWSLIHGFRAVSQGVQPLQINKIVTGFVHETFATKDVILKKCYSLNSKYILQAFKGTQFSNIIFSSLLGSNSVDLVYQFNINLISNIIMHPLFVFKDLGNDWARGIDCLIKRVIEIRKIETYGEEFNRIYPAMFRLGTKMLQHPSSKEYQQQLALQIKKWLKNLIYDQTISTIKAISPQNLIETNSLKKLNELLINFQDISVLLLQEGETRERGTYWMLKHHVFELREILKLLDYKYKQYSDYVQGRIFENFQVSEIVQFRERYNTFICNFIKLFSLRSRIEIKDESIPAEKKNRIMKQRTELIQIAEKRLFQDFEAQIEFKCANYLPTVLEYYKFLLIEKKAKYTDLINQSIKGITGAFSQHRVSNLERMITAKLIFWKGLIENFMEEIKIENAEELVKIYNQFAQYSANNAQLCLEIIERVLEKLESQYKQVEPPSIWSQFMQLFKATFEKLFDEVCKREQFFKRIASILYYSIVVADGSEKKLAGPVQGKKSNVQALFLFLRQHIKNTIGECGEQQDYLLQMLFKQRNKERFINIMKDYKVGLMRWIKFNTTST